MVVVSVNRPTALPIFPPKELFPRHSHLNATKYRAKHAYDAVCGCELGPIRTNDLEFRSRESLALGTALAIGHAAPWPAPKLVSASIGT